MTRCKGCEQETTPHVSGMCAECRAEAAEALEAELAAAEPTHDNYADLAPDPPASLSATDKERFEAELARLRGNPDPDGESVPDVASQTDLVQGWRAGVLSGSELEPADQGRLPDFTDADNAARFARLHGDHMKWVHGWRKWIAWTGTRWVVDPGGVLVLEMAKDVPRELFRRAQADLGAAEMRQAAVLSSRSKLTAMVDLAKAIDPVLVEHGQLDANPWALQVGNGWLDLRSGGFHPPDPNMLMTLQAGAAWDPTATAPLWEKSLAEWMPDPDLRDYFQRLCGASLVGQIRDHMLVIVYGPGGNGKGTALGAIGHVLGDYFTVPHKSLLVATRHEAHDTVKASLFRVRMAVAAESDKRVRLNEASIKELTGGDQLRARRLYEDEWSFVPSHTMWLQTNHLPEVSGGDRGIWRRIRVLPWTATFAGAAEDRNLPEKLEEESPGILGWLVEGVARWLELGVDDVHLPEVVRDATQEYEEAEDVVGRWAGEIGLTLADHLTVDAKDLTDSWKHWTETEYGRARRFNEVAEWLNGHGCRRDTIRRQVEGARKVRTIWYGAGWTDATIDQIAP